MIFAPLKQSASRPAQSLISSHLTFILQVVLSIKIDLVKQLKLDASRLILRVTLIHNEKVSIPLHHYAACIQVSHTKGKRALH